MTLAHESSDVWSAVTRRRFLFQEIWLWESRSLVLPTSTEIEMNVRYFSTPINKNSVLER